MCAVDLNNADATGGKRTTVDCLVDLSCGLGRSRHLRVYHAQWFELVRSRGSRSTGATGE